MGYNMKINAAHSTGKFFLLKTEKQCQENDYYFDNDNDCFYDKYENQHWYESEIDTISIIGFIDNLNYGKLVEVFDVVAGDQLDRCYQVNNEADYSTLDDWMGRYIDPEEEPEYLV